jgi:MFS family permease
VSMTAVFLASFGFFGAIIFLPLWYQAVQGASATASGYQLLPLLAGLILSSIVSGQIVSRTGRYKWLTVGALVTMTAGLLLMTNLRSDTPAPMLWVWQFIAGVGVGPTLAVFTIIIQNSVPWQKLGVATSNMTFFRQVGGSVGLALAGTIFGSAFRTQAPIQVGAELSKAHAPQQLISGLTGQFAALNSQQFSDFSGVGDLGARILDTIRQTAGDAAAAAVQPFISNIVLGIHEGFSLAIADTMWLAALAALAATATTLLLHEVALRHEHVAESPVAVKPAPVAEL